VADTPAPVVERSRLERLLGETEPVRRALYPVVVCVVALLVAYGLLDAERVPLWLALAVAILGPGSIEAARAVAWAPATVADYGAGWHEALAGEYRRGVHDGMTAAHERTPDEVAHELLDDTPGQHAVDRPRGDLDATGLLPRVDDATVPRDPATGLLRAPSRAQRCREVEDGRRCALPREHGGPHHMSTG
jgi:hypothetical protein